MDILILWTLLSCITVTSFDLVIAAIPDPKFVWPLGSNAYLSEVLTGTAQNNGQCGIKFSDTLSSLNYLPLVFDGNENPYVDLNVGQDTFTDLSVTIAIKPTTASANGYLFHYRHTGSNSMLTEFYIRFVNGMIYGYRLHSKASPEVIKVSVSMASNHWYFFSMVFKESNGDFNIYIDSHTYANNDNFVQNMRLETPGVLRIGGHLDGTLPYFQGEITCLAFHSEFITGSSKADVLTYCRDSSQWKVSPTGLPASPISGGCSATTQAPTTTTTAPPTTRTTTTTTTLPPTTTTPPPPTTTTTTTAPPTTTTTAPPTTTTTTPRTTTTTAPRTTTTTPPPTTTTTAPPTTTTTPPPTITTTAPPTTTTTMPPTTTTTIPPTTTTTMPPTTTTTIETTSTTTELVIVKRNYGYYTRIARNSEPSLQAPSMQFPVVSVHRCASKCLRDKYCLSFTVFSSFYGKVCSFFTQIYLSGTSARQNVHYYKLNEY